MSLAALALVPRIPRTPVIATPDGLSVIAETEADIAIIERMWAISGGQERAPVPTLADVARDPSRLDALPIDVLISLRRACGHLYNDLDAAIARQQQTRSLGTAEPERVVLIDEAARMLATSEDTLHSKWRKLAFAYKDPLDGKIKFRVTGLDRYIAGRRASNAS